MGLCANDSKRRRPFKTIIIPKGIINPNENNIIEIPMDLDGSNSLIVKAPNDANPCFSVEPFRGDLLQMPERPLQIVNPVDTSWTQEMHRPQNADFGAQTTSSTYTPNPTYFPEAHSPLCPICARASCKFFPSSGMRHPTPYPQPSYTSPTRAPLSFTPSVTKFPPPSFTRSSSYPNRIEELENETLNRLVEEKIDKVLKPILLSIAKYSSDQEEKYMGAFPGMASWSSIRPDHYRKYEPEDRCNKKSDEVDFDELKRALGKKPRRSTRGSFEDLNAGYRRPDCQASAACPRRTSVSFDHPTTSEDGMSSETRPLHRSSKASDLNTTFLE